MESVVKKWRKKPALALHRPIDLVPSEAKKD
jgi:hypothetical protein